MRALPIKYSNKYLVLEVVPGLAAQEVADGELEQVQGEVSDEAVEPDDAGPFQPDAPDVRKLPVRVCCYSSGNLQNHQTQL
jgi:hypothetical protein